MGLKQELRARKALMNHSKGNTEEAYREYEAMYAEGTLTAAKYLLPYSILLLRRGEYEKTREVLKKAEKAPGGLDDSQRALLLNNYAVASWKLGKMDYAIELLQKVHAKTPSGNSYATLGFLLVERGNYDEALSFNKDAVEYDDEDAILLDNLAQTYYRLGGDEGQKEARAWFEKAVKFKPDAIDTNYFLACYDIADGKFDDAREKLEICSAGRVSPLNYATRERVSELLKSLPE